MSGKDTFNFISEMSLLSAIQNSPVRKISTKVKLLILFMWLSWSAVLVGDSKLMYGTVIFTLKSIF